MVTIIEKIAGMSESQMWESEQHDSIYPIYNPKSCFYDKSERVSVIEAELARRVANSNKSLLESLSRED